MNKTKILRSGRGAYRRGVDVSVRLGDAAVNLWGRMMGLGRGGEGRSGVGLKSDVPGTGAAKGRGRVQKTVDLIKSMEWRREWRGIHLPASVLGSLEEKRARGKRAAKDDAEVLALPSTVDGGHADRATAADAPPPAAQITKEDVEVEVIAPPSLVEGGHVEKLAEAEMHQTQQIHEMRAEDVSEELHQTPWERQTILSPELFSTHSKVFSPGPSVPLYPLLACAALYLAIKFLLFKKLPTSRNRSRLARSIKEKKLTETWISGSRVQFRLSLENLQEHITGWKTRYGTRKDREGERKPTRSKSQGGEWGISPSDGNESEGSSSLSRLGGAGSRGSGHHDDISLESDSGSHPSTGCGRSGICASSSYGLDENYFFRWTDLNEKMDRARRRITRLEDGAKRARKQLESYRGRLAKAEEGRAASDILRSRLADQLEAARLESKRLSRRVSLLSETERERSSALAASEMRSTLCLREAARLEKENNILEERVGRLEEENDQLEEEMERLVDRVENLKDDDGKGEGSLAGESVKFEEGLGDAGSLLAESLTADPGEVCFGDDQDDWDTFSGNDGVGGMHRKLDAVNAQVVRLTEERDAALAELSRMKSLNKLEGTPCHDLMSASAEGVDIPDSVSAGNTTEDYETIRIERDELARIMARLAVIRDALLTRDSISVGGRLIGSKNKDAAAIVKDGDAGFEMKHQASKLLLWVEGLVEELKSKDHFVASFMSERDKLESNLKRLKEDIGCVAENKWLLAKPHEAEENLALLLAENKVLKLRMAEILGTCEEAMLGKCGVEVCLELKRVEAASKLRIAEGPSTQFQNEIEDLVEEKTEIQLQK